MKDKLKRNWRLILGIVLLLAAVFTFVKVYLAEKEEHEQQVQQLNMYITALERNIAENMKYAHIQDELDDAIAEVKASQLELYESFPVELKEEDQIMYVLYLETLFGTEINFSFSTPQAMGMLSEGTLMGMTLTVNYETTYDGFKDMIDYLATDDRIVSVYNATIEYDAKRDKAVGDVTLLLYLIDSPLLDYASPDVNVPDTGKDSIFD